MEFMLSVSDLLEELFLGSVGRTKKKRKPEIEMFIMSVDEKTCWKAFFFP